MHPGIAIIVLWIAFWVSWFAASRWTHKTEKRVGFGPELAYRAVVTAGGLILAVPAHHYYGPLRFWHVGWLEAWGCVGAMVLGLAFAWWARVHLGRFWSASITRKVDHRVIDTGPYGIVRHPIYTGILFAVFATATAKGTLFGLLGALVITIGLWMKARTEENWLRQELGAESYDGYRRRVPMLLPFGPK